MMFNFNNLIIVILFLICSCGEEEIYLVGLKGTLKGYIYGVSQVDGSGPLENTLVTIEGSDPEITLRTDSNGKFSISDLETGTYHIVFSKAGYGKHKILGYTFVGGSVPSTVTTTLYALPSIEIKDLDVSIIKSGPYIWLNGSIYVDLPETVGEYGYFRYYLDNQPDVSPTRYIESDILAYFYPGSSNNFSKPLNTTKFPLGSDLYLVIYPCSDQLAGYPDLETGNKIYSSISLKGSEVISIKIPM